MNDALLGDELKDTGVSGGSRVLGVPKLEHPWGFKIKRSEVSKSGCRQNDYVRSVRKSEVVQIKLGTYSFRRSSSSLVHGREASQHCTLSDTHRTSSGLLFDLRENQNHHLNPCESFIRRFLYVGHK